MALTKIRRVALEAGVSVATVSRTFQYPERVSPATRKKVEEVAERFHYAPNAQARLLRTQRSNLIIALTPNIVNPFFAEVITGIEDAAQENGYSVLLGDTRGQIENERRYGDLVSTRQADGIITLIPRIPPVRLSSRPPIVSACERVEDDNISSVSVDSADACRRAVEYLITLGHRKIALVGGEPDSPHTLDRRAGYETALRNAGLVPNQRLYIDGQYSEEAGRRAAHNILSQGDEVTAFACVNDQIAIGVLKALEELSIEVPKNMSVIGFDDIKFSRFTRPALTTVAQPSEALGREATLMLLNILRDNLVPTRKLVLPTELVVRGTTAPPASSKKGV